MIVELVMGESPCVISTDCSDKFTPHLFPRGRNVRGQYLTRRSYMFTQIDDLILWIRTFMHEGDIYCLNVPDMLFGEEQGRE